VCGWFSVPKQQEKILSLGSEKRGFFASKHNRTNLKRNEREMKKNKRSKTKSVKRNDVKKIWSKMKNAM
jgi:hypothetical protein